MCRAFILAAVLLIFGKMKLLTPSVKTHIAKTISWRVLGTAGTIIIAWLISGNLEIGLKIGAVELVAKMLLYFLHERLWHHISLRSTKDNS